MSFFCKLLHAITATSPVSSFNVQSGKKQFFWLKVHQINKINKYMQEHVGNMQEHKNIQEEEDFEKGISV